jgi:hypothetical protein
MISASCPFLFSTDLKSSIAEATSSPGKKPRFPNITANFISQSSSVRVAFEVMVFICIGVCYPKQSLNCNTIASHSPNEWDANEEKENESCKKAWAVVSHICGGILRAGGNGNGKRYCVAVYYS